MRLTSRVLSWVSVWVATKQETNTPSWLVMPSPSKLAVSSSTETGSKLEKEGLLPPNWDRCHFYIVGKRRFCRQRPLDNTTSSSNTEAPRYCGNHQHVAVSSENVRHSESNATESNDINSCQRKRKRIPCPLDSTHFIYEDQAAKHVKVCPYRTRHDGQKEKDYYQHNVNLGGHGSLDLENLANPQPQEWAHQLALRVLQVHQELFTTTSLKSGVPSISSTLTEKANSVKHLSKSDIIDALPMLDYHTEEIDLLTRGVQHYRIKSGGPRHLAQQASFIGHIRRILFASECQEEENPREQDLGNPDGSKSGQNATATKNSEPTTILEMGAGRGMLGLMVAGVVAVQNDTTQLVMIERSGTRGKADTVLRAALAAGDSSSESKVSSPINYMNLTRIQSWKRVRCDLAHVHLPSLMQLPEQHKSAVESSPYVSNDQPKNHSILASGRLVVVAKHLCGAGTDLALKSLVPVRQRVDACLMATCCHGVCSWEHYVGRDYLRRVLQMDKFGPTEFDLIRRWASATASHGAELLYDSATPLGSSGKEGTDPLVGLTCQSFLESSDATQVHNQEREFDAVDDVLDQPDSENQKSFEVPKDPNTSIYSIVKHLDLACGISGLGKACQRLIDYGRCEYMRQVLFFRQDEHIENSQVDICSFVPSSITPQNTLLRAFRKSCID